MAFASLIMLIAPILMPLILLSDSKKRLGKYRWGWAVFAAITPLSLIGTVHRQILEISEVGARGADLGAVWGTVLAACFAPFLMYRSSTKGDVKLKAEANSAGNDTVKYAQKSISDSEYAENIRTQYSEMSNDDFYSLVPKNLTEDARIVYEQEVLRRKNSNQIITPKHIEINTSNRSLEEDLPLTEDLFVAAKRGDKSKVLRLLSAGADPTYKDEWGHTPRESVEQLSKRIISILQKAEVEWGNKSISVEIENKPENSSRISSQRVVKEENIESVSESDLIGSLEQLKKETAEQWLSLDKPVQGEIMAVMVMTAAFDFLQEKVSDPFNAILNNAKSLFPSNSALRNIEKLDLGPPDRNFDINDIPLVSAQFKQALEKMDQLKKILSK